MSAISVMMLICFVGGPGNHQQAQPVVDQFLRHVERSAGEPRAEVLDAEDRPTALTLGRGGLFGAAVYSQNEIERIAGC